MDFEPPSPQEIENVQSIKKRFEDINIKFTDIKILRFLRGRKGDVDKAYHGLKKHIEWRQENSVDLITVDSFQSEDNLKKIVLKGFDNKK